jgi:hypothetical protein
VLDKLHTIFVKVPLGLVMLLILGIEHYIRVRQVGRGIYLEYLKDLAFFIPCNRRAQKVLDRYAGKYPKMPNYYTGRIIPITDSKQVYEAIMHDPNDPQCITSVAKLLPGVLVTDTPGY